MPTTRRTPSAAAPAPSSTPASVDANELELFARVVAARSFAAAGRDLGLTRAAISRRVATLEERLGVRLFARTTRALGLTEAGRRLAQRARAVLEAAEAARRVVRRGTLAGDGGEGEALHGSLRITSVPTFAQTVLAPLLAEFQQRHPAVRLELRLTARRMDLLRDDVDVAFRLTRRPPPDCVAVPLMRFEVRAYGSPARAPSLDDPQALAQARCLVFGLPMDEATVTWVHDDGRQATVTLEPVLVGDDLGTLARMAEVGSDLVFAPEFTVAQALAAGTLADRLPGWRVVVPEGDQIHALMLPRPEGSEAARQLVRFVRERLASRPRPAA
ncbi:MAG: LysR family transcriptional regulator [Rubrivivax sp.]